MEVKNGTQNFVLSISDEDFTRLVHLSGEAGISIDTFFKDAVRVYQYIITHSMRGKEFFIGQEDKVEKRLIMLEIPAEVKDERGEAD